MGQARASAAFVGHTGYYLENSGIILVGPLRETWLRVILFNDEHEAHKSWK
jgi:hypothetical protein